MAGKNQYLVLVPIVQMKEISIVADTPEDALEYAGAIANMMLVGDGDYVKVIHSDQIPWKVCRPDGSSPNPYEKIYVVGQGEKWFRYGRQKKGYGY